MSLPRELWIYILEIKCNWPKRKRFLNTIEKLENTLKFPTALSNCNSTCVGRHYWEVYYTTNPNLYNTIYYGFSNGHIYFWTCIRWKNGDEELSVNITQAL